MFLFIGVMEHFAVVSGVVRLILRAPGSVGAAEESNFLGDEFTRGGGCKVAVVGWVVA